VRVNGIAASLVIGAVPGATGAAKYNRSAATIAAQPGLYRSGAPLTTAAPAGLLPLSRAIRSRMLAVVHVRTL